MQALTQFLFTFASKASNDETAITLAQLESDIQRKIQALSAGVPLNTTQMELERLSLSLEKLSKSQDSTSLIRLQRLFGQFVGLVDAERQQITLAHDKVYDFLQIQWQPNELQSELTWLFDALKSLFSLPTTKDVTPVDSYLSSLTAQLKKQLLEQGAITLKKERGLLDHIFQVFIQQKALAILEPEGKSSACLPEACELFLKVELLKHGYFGIDNREKLELTLYLLQNVSSYQQKFVQSLATDALLAELCKRFRPMFAPSAIAALANLHFRLAQAHLKELSLPMSYLFYAQGMIWLEQQPHSLPELRNILLLLKTTVRPDCHFVLLARAIYAKEYSPERKSCLQHFSTAPPDFETAPFKSLSMLYAQFVLVRAHQNIGSLVAFERRYLLQLLTHYLQNIQVCHELLMFNSLAELEHLLYLERDELKEVIVQIRGEELYDSWLEVMKNYHLFLNNYKLFPRGKKPEYLIAVEAALTKHATTQMKACLADMHRLWSTR